MKKKLSIIAAGAALSSVAVGAPVTTSAAVSAPLHTDTAHHAVATNRSAAPSKTRIAALFDRWNAAVETGDPEKVAALYAPDAVLLPTLSPQIRTTHDEIVDYFKGFLARSPACPGGPSVIAARWRGGLGGSGLADRSGWSPPGRGAMSTG